MPSLSQSICLGREASEARRLSPPVAGVSLPIDDVVTPQNRSPRTHDHRAWCVLCAALACPPRAASPCPFVSSCQPTTRGPPAAVHLQSGQLVRRVHAGCHLAKSRERRDAHTDRASIGVGTCLRLNLEPRRLLYIIGIACCLRPYPVRHPRQPSSSPPRLSTRAME